MIGAATVEDLVAHLDPPRRILLMVRAGEAVDALIRRLTPLLDQHDVIIDGGNSHFEDTRRRTAELDAVGIRFVGAGISGGEEGARHGPSIMPGGSPEAWPQVRGVLQEIAAKVSDGTPCCDWVGSDGAGHFVKMVHNGIEYGDIQLLAESYHLMHAGLGLDYPAMASVFEGWNDGMLDSYLVEITSRVLAYRQDGEPLLEMIVDAAGQKGTGTWTAISALDLGMPVSLVAEAVFARMLSSLTGERATASAVLAGPSTRIVDDPADVISDLEQALYASKIVSYGQGFMLMKAADEAYGWELDPGGIALMWREGCVIRASFLDRIREAYEREPAIANLLLDPYFSQALQEAQGGWRRTVARAVHAGIPVPGHAAALAFYDAYRSARLPANLIQGLRDYFGAHTYERVDRPRGEFHHTDWTDNAGAVPSQGSSA